MGAILSAYPIHVVSHIQHYVQQYMRSFTSGWIILYQDLMNLYYSLLD